MPSIPATSVDQIDAKWPVAARPDTRLRERQHPITQIPNTYGLGATHARAVGGGAGLWI